jgi:hypothetical protein
VLVRREERSLRRVIYPTIPPARIISYSHKASLNKRRLHNLTLSIHALCTPHSGTCAQAILLFRRNRNRTLNKVKMVLEMCEFREMRRKRRKSRHNPGDLLFLDIAFFAFSFGCMREKSGVSERKRETGGRGLYIP